MAFILIFGLAIIIATGNLLFRIWRVRQFSKATKMGFWKAFFVLGE